MTLRRQFITAEQTDTFQCLTEIIVWIAAVNLTFLLYSFTLFMLSPLPDRQFDFAIFAFNTIVAPIVSAAVITRCTRRDAIEQSVCGPIIFSFLAIIVLAAIAMTLLALVLLFPGLSVSSWKASASGVVIGLTVTHSVMIAVIFLLPPRALGQIADHLRNIQSPRGQLETPMVFSIIVLTAMLIVLAATFFVFRVEPNVSFSYGVFGRVAGLIPKPGLAVLLVLAAILALLMFAACARWLWFKYEQIQNQPGRLARIQTWALVLVVVAIFYYSFDPVVGMLLVLAAILALLIFAACARLLRFEDGQRQNQPGRLARIQIRTLVLVVVAIFYYYFDFAFNSDVLHFLANVGPAAQIYYGDGVPMVSAFSQYGAGPLVLTWLGFLISSPSFNAANIVSQLHSLAFYAVIIVCLYRMAPYRLAALLMGFAAIGVVLAGWWGGLHSLNSVPSAMGLRYLPCALVVLAISVLEKGNKGSLFLFAALSLSTMWSFEALLGSVAIAGLFFLIKATSDRDLAGFVRCLALGILLPIAAGLGLMAAITLFWAGVLPDIATYLEFAKIYNLTSKFWSITSDGTFLGWVPVAAVVMTVFSLAWLSAFGQAKVNALWSSQLLIYRFVPMAGLTAFMSSYYVGRSVDFTLIISFLPFSALVIPASLVLFRQAQGGEMRYRYLAAIPALVVFLALSFSIAALYRKNSPYSLAVNQCIHLGNCSPIGLAATLKQRYPLRPMLDQAANPNFYDTSGLAREAIGLIERYEPGRKKIALFLGIHPLTIWSVHTNTVLLLAGKAHRWPISYVLSDELNPARRRRILAANTQLENGETVFVRKDEGRLGELEAAILRKIRAAAQLCPLPAIGDMVMAYRVSIGQACDVTLNRQTPKRSAAETTEQ